MGRESHTSASAVTSGPELITRFNDSSCPPSLERLTDSGKFHMQATTWLEFLSLIGSPCRTREKLTAEPLTSLGNQSYVTPHISHPITYVSSHHKSFMSMSNLCFRSHILKQPLIICCTWEEMSLLSPIPPPRGVRFPSRDHSSERLLSSGGFATTSFVIMLEHEQFFSSSVTAKNFRILWTATAPGHLWCIYFYVQELFFYPKTFRMSSAVMVVNTTAVNWSLSGPGRNRQ